jgi:biopolymer transport protein ExbD
MNLGRRNKVIVQGEMSSMTDLIFLMLIFFIIMSTMSEPGIPVDLPSGTTAAPPSKPVLNVGVTADNMYMLSDATEVLYTFEEIEPIIISKMDGELSDNDKIKISGDKDADYQYVFRLIALAKEKEWKPILVFE